MFSSFREAASLVKRNPPDFACRRKHKRFQFQQLASI